MKKLISIFIIAAVMVSSAICVSAQTVDRETVGVKFDLPDDWLMYQDEVKNLCFYHSSNTSQMETIAIYAIQKAEAFSYELLNDISLSGYYRRLCNQVYSDAQLASDLSKDNGGASVTVNAASVIDGFEVYNGVKYYRYEKAYTAKLKRQEDTSFYLSAFVTSKNGHIYFIEYSRSTGSNHFSDVLGVLNSISFENGEVKIFINDDRIYSDSAPMILQGRTLVPIRAVAEAMGYQVDWNGSERLVILENGETTIELTIGSNILIKNFEEEIPLDVAPYILNDRTYLPLRGVTEAMNAQISWNNSARAVEIWK